MTSHDELGERVPDSIPTVVYGYPHEKYDSIYPDWEEIMKMIFRHLYERGYRKFGYAGHWATRKTRQDILKKFLRTKICRSEPTGFTAIGMFRMSAWLPRESS